ncbi:MAG: NAD(P)/FAD-dependent oxidoreductase [Dongiaceae bacterium]
MSAGPASGAPVIVVGAGFTGLAAAWELVRRGRRPVLLEAEAEPGGLAAAFHAGGTRLERFYHHWFTSDREVDRLVGELGLADHVTVGATRTGLYYRRQLYRLSRPLDLLRFTPLPPLDRLRLGLLLLRARRIADWRTLDRVPAAQWLRQLGGRRVFEVVWAPLLQGKFGRHADEVSAAWFWAKLRLRGGSRGRGGEERLAYFRGGFAALADAMVEAIRAAGGEFHPGRAATGLLRDAEGRIAGVATERGPVAGAAVLLTAALPQIAAILGDAVPPDYRARLAGIGYLANVCVVLELTRSLSELYWMNVNDPGFPFVGVIEHTHLDQADPTGRRRVVYLSRYLPADDPAFAWSDAETVDFTLAHLRRMFPDLDPATVTAAHVWRARYAQPIVACGYADRVPGPETPIPGAWIASMAQVYPEDRGTNYAIRDGRRTAALIDAWLSGQG